MERSWTRDERDSLQQLQMFNVRQPLALLLAAFGCFGDQDRNDFAKVLRAIAIISFRYNVICGLPSNEQEKVYNHIAQRLAAGTFSSAREVVSALQPVCSEDTVFKAAFADKELRTTNSRNKKVVRYILFSLEKHCSGHGFDFENSDYTLEHILPEHPEQGWDAFDSQSYDNSVYQLGNMTLLSATANRNLGNVPYLEKRIVYSESEFSISQGIAKRYDDWTPATIQSRQDWMAKQAIAIWNISF